MPYKKLAEAAPLFNAAFIKYRPFAQMQILQEECAELIVAACHLKRGRSGAMKEFIEELADVLIMTGQFVQYLERLKLDNNLKMAIQKKLDRLQKRLEQK